MDKTSPGAPDKNEPSALRTIAVSLIVNAAAPIAVYYELRLAGVDQWTALLLGLIPPATNTTYSLVTTRKVDMLGWLVMTALGLSVGLSLLAGSPRSILARDGWVTAVLGLWILITLRRPTPYYLFALLTFTRGRMREQVAYAWEHSSRFRRMVTVGTIIWGSALLLDAASTVVIAYTLPIDSVPLIGAVKLVVLILLAEILSQISFRLNGLPLLDLEEPDDDGGAGQATNPEPSERSGGLETKEQR